MAHLAWVTQRQIDSKPPPMGVTPLWEPASLPVRRMTETAMNKFSGLGRSWTPPSFASSWNAASPLSAGTSPPPSFLSSGIPPPFRAASMRAPKKPHMRAARATDRKHALRFLARRSRSLGFGRPGVQFPAAGRALLQVHERQRMVAARAEISPAHLTPPQDDPPLRHHWAPAGSPP